MNTRRNLISMITYMTISTAIRPHIFPQIYSMSEIRLGHVGM